MRDLFTFSGLEQNPCFWLQWKGYSHYTSLESHLLPHSHNRSGPCQGALQSPCNGQAAGDFLYAASHGVFVVCLHICFPSTDIVFVPKLVLSGQNGRMELQVSVRPFHEARRASRLLMGCALWDSQGTTWTLVINTRVHGGKKDRGTWWQRQSCGPEGAGGCASVGRLRRRWTSKLILKEQRSNRIKREGPGIIIGDLVYQITLRQPQKALTSSYHRKLKHSGPNPHMKLIVHWNMKQLIIQSKTSRTPYLSQ